MRVQPKSHKKTIIIAISIVSVLLVASLIWYYAFSSRDSEEAQNATESQQEQASNDKQDVKKTDTKDPDNNPLEQSVSHEKEKELPQLYEGGGADTSNRLTGAITAKSVMGENLVIRNTINQIVSNGICKLILVSGNKTVTKSVEIIQNPSSSSCAGFDIPVTELSPGQWSVELYVSSGDKNMILKETVNI